MAGGAASAQLPILFNKFFDGSLRISWTTVEKDENRLWRAFACSGDPAVTDAVREFRFCMYNTGVPYAASPIVCGLDNSVPEMSMWLYNTMYAPWVIKVVAMNRLLKLRDMDRMIDEYVEHAKRYTAFVERDPAESSALEPVHVGCISRQLRADLGVIDADLLQEYADVLDTIARWVGIYSYTSEQVNESMNKQLSTMGDMARAYADLHKVTKEDEKAELLTVMKKGQDLFLNNFQEHHEWLLGNSISKVQIIDLRPVVEGMRESYDDACRLPTFRAMLVAPQEIKDKVDAALRTRRMEDALLAEAEEIEEEDI